MKINNNISVSKSGFVFDSRSGDSYSLNGTAREIMELLMEGRSEEDINEYFVTKYHVDANLFSRHFDDYIQVLSHYNIVRHERTNE